MGRQGFLECIRATSCVASRFRFGCHLSYIEQAELCSSYELPFQCDGVAVFTGKAKCK